MAADQASEFAGAGAPSSAARSVIVRSADRHDRPLMTAMLTRAFAVDPASRWLVSDDRDRLRPFMRLQVNAFARHGTIDVAVAGDALPDGPLPSGPHCPEAVTGVVGAALWMGPDRWEPPRASQLLQLPSMVGVFRRRLGMASSVYRAILAHHPRERHWYLGVLGVDPSAQGGGVGGALLRRGLAVCDASGLPAYLETATAIDEAIYERFGFAVRERISLPHGAPTLTTMWRPPINDGRSTSVADRQQGE